MLNRKTMLLLFFALAAFAAPVRAQSADVPLISASRLSFGFGVEKHWVYESFDVGTQVGSEWFADLPFAYTLPTTIPAAITGRAEKALTSRNVGFRLGLQVVLFRNGAWTVGQ